MAKKKMSKLEAIKTRVKIETPLIGSIAKTKRKIKDRKRTNSVLTRMRKGQAVSVTESSRAAQAVAERRRRGKR